MSKHFSFREIMVFVWLVFAAALLVVYYRQLGSVWQLGPLAWARNQPSLDIFYNSLLKLLEVHTGTAAQAARQALRGLAGAVIVLSAAQVTGVGTLRILRSLFPGLRFEDGIDRLLYRTVLGLGGIAYLSLALAAVGLYTPVMVRMLILSCLTVGGFALLLSRSSWPHKKTSRSFYLELGARRWKLIIGLALGVALIGALAPEIEWDALWYHLWLPERWLEAGRPVDIVKEYISLYPLTWELGYGAALSFGGPLAAKLLHFTCLPLTALLVFQIVRRFFPGASPWLAAALLVTTPTVLWEATTAYNDLALALYLGLAIYAVLLYDREQETSWLVVAALCLGLSLAIKHLALIGLVILVPGLTLYLWRKGNDLKSWLGPALSFGLLAMLLPLPWYLRNFFASGNPVFPDLYNLFGAFPPERWSAVTERGLNGFKAGFGDPRTLLNLAALPWNATVHAARYGGSLGPLFLVLIPGLVFSWRSHRTAVFLSAFAAGYLALWASPLSSFQLRFLVPLAPVLAVLASAGFASLSSLAERLSWGPKILGAVVTAMLLLNLPPFTSLHESDRSGWQGWLTHVVHEVPFEVVLGAENRDAYLARRVPSYRAWQYINTNLAPDALVLTFSGGDHFYSHRPRLSADATLAHAAVWGASPDQEPQAVVRLRELGVTHILYDRSMLGSPDAAYAAILQPEFLDRYLEKVYTDERFLLFRLIP